ncbi:MAG: sugar phosphate isomerase/epimerase [Acidobacteriales bacterium]|nr:sugar phosphate isomerase/epimerase [Terriglobales bacterium]
MKRRQLLAAPLAALPLWAGNRIDRSRFSALTDEIGASEQEAFDFAKQYGLRWIEVRGVPGGRRDYVDLPAAELHAFAKKVRDHGLKVSYLDAPLLKFALPGFEPVERAKDTAGQRAKRAAEGDRRFTRRMDDLRLALDAAEILGTRKVRVFAFQRVREREKAMPRVAEILAGMAETAGRRGIHLLLENEGSCNVATCAEAAELLKMVPSKWFGFNWDCLNGVGYKENPFPEAYSIIPKDRLGNVHIKGRSVLPGPYRMDWTAVFKALERDGYKGEIGLETHIWDNMIEKSHASMREMIRLVEG